MKLAVVWVLACALVACDAPREETVPAPPSAEPFDHAAYCAEMCERAAVCGAEAAAPLRSSGDPPEATLAREAAAECIAGCRSETPGEDQALNIERAQVCLRRQGCDELVKCLEVL